MTTLVRLFTNYTSLPSPTDFSKLSGARNGDTIRRIGASAAGATSTCPTHGFASNFVIGGDRLQDQNSYRAYLDVGQPGRLPSVFGQNSTTRTVQILRRPNPDFSSA